MPSVGQHKADRAPPAHLHTVPAAVAATAAHHTAGKARLARSRLRLRPGGTRLLQTAANAGCRCTLVLRCMVAAGGPIISCRHSTEPPLEISCLLLICM